MNDNLPMKPVSFIRPGDILIREHDHLGREDASVIVLDKRTDGKVRFRLQGFGTDRWVYGSETVSRELLDHRA